MKQYLAKVTVALALLGALLGGIGLASSGQAAPVQTVAGAICERTVDDNCTHKAPTPVPLTR